MLDEVAGNGMNKLYSGSTNDTLAYVDGLYASLADRASTILGIGGDAQKAINILREVTGLWGVLKGIFGLRNVNALEWPKFQQQFAVFLNVLNRYAIFVTGPSYALAIGLPLGELVVRDPFMQAIDKAVISGPVGDQPEISFANVLKNAGDFYGGWIKSLLGT
jgi:hypothetical protein